MGTIGDLLGGIPGEWQEALAAAEQPTEAETDGGDKAPGADAVAIEVILDETGFAAEQMRPDLRLVEDLDLSGLALWSVVSRIERELKRNFPDDTVESWRTLGDLLSAVGEAR